MAKNRPINSDFWIDEYIEKIGINERYLFLYFLTNPDCNILGIYKTTIKRIASDTDLTHEQVLKIIEKFEKDDKIYFKSGHIIIVNFLKNQKPNPMMLKGINRLLIGLPYPIKAFISSNKSSIYDTLSIGFKSLLVGFESLQKNKDKNKSINKDQNKNKNNLKGTKNINIENDFLLFWEQYPKKTGKQKAAEAWKKNLKIHKLKSNELLDKIIKSLSWQINCPEWTKENGQFIPMPTTYLNQGRWDDEPVIQNNNYSDTTKHNIGVGEEWLNDRKD